MDKESTPGPARSAGTPKAEQCSICLSNPPYGGCAGGESCAYIMKLQRELDEAERRCADLEKDAGRLEKEIVRGAISLVRAAGGRIEVPHLYLADDRWQLNRFEDFANATYIYTAQLMDAALAAREEKP